jgi:hypothetical protein
MHKDFACASACVEVYDRPSHGGNTGSNPVGDATKKRSIALAIVTEKTSARPIRSADNSIAMGLDERVGPR